MTHVMSADTHACAQSTEPVCRSNIKKHKHLDPVWEVTWRTEDAGRGPVFASVSTDGRVSQWTLRKNDLECQVRLSASFRP